MSQALSSLGRTLAAHAVLATCTVIALFPVFVILINSLKSRRALFAEPLALPDAVRSLAVCLAADESIRTGRPRRL